MFFVDVGNLDNKDFQLFHKKHLVKFKHVNLFQDF